jgi:hypothetical protein
VTLLRAARESTLEPSRVAVGAFLLDHGILGAPKHDARVRVAPSAPPATRIEETAEDDAERELSERAGRR